ncbi:hypothetical protein T484DRAFT_1838135 [Baffinella frigidus]|nr:hypothetical protein T484DRAFT_1838135 [Cryptophyta sp. CCMP2293]
MLSKFRCSLRSIRDAILALDSKVLTPDDVASLEQYVPTDDELALLRAFDGSAEGLGIAERFFLEILEIPRYKERLAIFSSLHSFDDVAAEVCVCV